MSRILVPILFGLAFFASQSPVPAADTVAGSWKGTFTVNTREGEVSVSLLFYFSEDGGKWTADFLDSSQKFTEDEVKPELTVNEDNVLLNIKFGPDKWSFEGKLQPGGKTIKGSLDLGGGIVLMEMVPSRLKSLSKDRFAVNKETLDTTTSASEFYSAIYPVIAQASAKKMKPEEVRAYADKATKMAEPYGPRWQRTVAFRLADSLAGQEPYVAIAVEQARQGERLLSRNDDILTQLQTLDTLARVLRKAKKDADAKEVDGRIAKLEPRDYLEYAKTMPPFKPEAFKGRKGKSERAVLVELFTGVESGESVGVELAFDSLSRTYKPMEVVLLQYHAHIPGPNPLVSKDGSLRMDFYNKRDDDKSAPQMFINGKQDGSGPAPQPRMAKLRYQAYSETINELLEKPATVKLNATVNRKGDELTFRVTVADLEKPGEKVFLRLALAEERVRYQGANGVRYHHAVVRAMPGGPKGFPLTKGTADQTVTLKLDDVRLANDKSLDEFVAVAKRQVPGFSFSVRPMDLKNLKLVAFVQNDETSEVLQAVQVDVEEKKE